MYPDIIAIGIPFMIACVVIEFLHDRSQPHSTFRLNTAISNVGCGVFEQMTGFLSKGLFVLLYVAVYERFRMYDIDNSPTMWLALIVLVDLVFYFFHRLSHRCSVLWSGHVVHHEIEHFNLTVALRRSVMQEFTIIWVYLPLAVVGFSPAAFFLIFAAHNLYQFLIHTSYLPEMRVLGLLFNTPYHHELHHCRNRCYIDKNFAGVFIIWDKLFGTFATHTETPRFGIGYASTTLNPVKAQITTLARVFDETRSRRGLRSRLQALFGSPAYLSDPDHAHDNAGGRSRFDPQPGPATMRRIILAFALLMIVGTIYRLHYEQVFGIWHQAAIMTVFVAVLFFIGRALDLSDRKPVRTTAGIGVTADTDASIPAITGSD